MKDITGQRFGRLVAIRPTERRGGNNEVKWFCRCDCGKTTEVNSGNLGEGTAGNTSSCGCLLADQWGENHPNHKFTAEQVNDIRHRYAAGFTTQKELAEKFGTSQTHIGRIARGVSWKNLPGGPVTRMSPVTRAPAIRQRRRIKQRNEGATMSKK